MTSLEERLRYLNQRLQTQEAQIQTVTDSVERTRNEIAKVEALIVELPVDDYEVGTFLVLEQSANASFVYYTYYVKIDDKLWRNQSGYTCRWDNIVDAFSRGVQPKLWRVTEMVEEF